MPRVLKPQLVKTIKHKAQDYQLFLDRNDLVFFAQVGAHRIVANSVEQLENDVRKKVDETKIIDWKTYVVVETSSQQNRPTVEMTSVSLGCDENGVWLQQYSPTNIHRSNLLKRHTGEMMIPQKIESSYAKDPINFVLETDQTSRVEMLNRVLETVRLNIMNIFEDQTELQDGKALFMYCIEKS